MTSDRRTSILMVARGLDPVGTGRQVELVAEGLREAGWLVRLAVTTAGGAVPASLARAGFPVHRLSGRPRVDLAAAAGLVRLVRSIRPSVVHAWGLSQARLVAAVRPLLPRTAAVVHVGVEPRPGGAAWPLRLADRVIASSPEVAAACGRAGVPAGRIDLVPPGIVAASPAGRSRDDLAARLGLAVGKTWTLCVAPLEPASRLERLLWAIDQLGVVHAGLEHVLVGAGPLRRLVERRARLQEIDERLRVVDHCDCLPDLLRQVRLVWQSGSVALGGAILDGMALGVPAVAVESGAARQLIVDGETGRVVPADPASEFPRRALGIIEDDALAARYGDAARMRAAEAFPPGESIRRHVAAVEAAITR